MIFRLNKVMEAEGTPAAAGGGGSTPPPSPVLGTPPPAPTPPANTGGNAPPKNSYEGTDWRSQLPDDVREEPSLKIMSDVTAMARSYVSAQKAIGSEKVVLPGKHATDDDWQKFYDATGRPPLDKFEINPPKEAKYLTKEKLAELKPLAHKLGVLPKQLEPVLEWAEKNVSAAEKAKADAGNQKIGEGLKSLQTEWGRAWEQKSAWAARVIAEDLGPEGIAFMKENPNFGNNPMLIKYFAKVGEDRYKEDKVINPGGGKGILTPQEATIKANEILVMGKDHPYGNPDHPNHKAAVEEVNELWRQAYPDQKEV